MSVVMAMTMIVTMAVLVGMRVTRGVGVGVHCREVYSTNLPRRLHPPRLPILETMTTGGCELVDAPTLDCHYHKGNGRAG